MPSARYLPDDRTIDVAAGEPLLDAALRDGIPHAHACGGHGVCSTCRVLVVDGLEQCRDRTDAELHIAELLQFPDGLRLACQTAIDGPVVVRRLVIDAWDVQFADQRGHDRPVPVGRQHDVAVLFADIRGFTGLASDLLPYDVIYILRRFFADADAIVAARQGRVTSYMGDGLMAVFGLEEPGAGPFDAVAAGLEMLAAIDRRIPQFEQLYERRIELNVGVHCGPAIVGTIGTWGDPPPVTAIGDTTNVASRIEEANKQLGTRMLVSADVWAAVGGRAVAGRRFTVCLAGKDDEHEVVEVTALR